MQTAYFWIRFNIKARALLSLFLMMVMGTAFADEFPAEPWGYDTPAGRCVVCHSLEKGGPFRVAPNLWGIVGAEKGRDREWYSYSAALVRTEGTWTEAELDAFLADASAFMPGSTKSIRVPDEAERKEIIDFLKTLD